MIDRAGFLTMKMHSVVLIFLAGCFLVSRVLFLDADLPAWQIAFYQPIDEFYYTIPAFNLFNFSQFSYSPILGEAGDGSNALANLLQNGITLLTLNLFGNTYFGLRMASVFAALISLILLFGASLSGLQKLSGERNGELEFYLVTAVFAIFVFDFSFNLGSRVAEPTIFSILYISVLAYGFSKIERVTNLNAVIIGALSGGAPFFGYLYLAYLVPASGFAIAAFTAREGVRKVTNNCVWFLIGVCGAIVFYLMFVVYVSSGEVERYISFINQAGGQRLAGTPLTVAALKSYGYDYLAGNIFRFNPALLATGLLSFFALIFFKTKKLPLLYYFVLTGLLFKFFQFLVLSDHYHRKLLDLVPFVFLLICAGLHLFLAARFNQKLSGWIRPVLSVLCAVAIFLLVVSEHRVFGYLFGKSLNIYGGDEILLKNNNLTLVLASVGLVCVAFLVSLLSNFSLRRIIFPILVLIACAIPGLVFSYKFIYSDAQFKFRDAQINLSPVVDNKVLVGGYSYAFRLYNKSVPYFNEYTFLGTPDEYDRRLAELLNNEKVWGVIGTSSLKLKAKKLVVDSSLEISDPIDIGDVEDKLKRYVLIHK